MAPVAYAVTAGLRAVAFYTTYLYISVTLATVLITTTPVFSLVVARFLIGTRISLPKAVLCLTVIIGVVLVVKPDEIFRAISMEKVLLSAFN